MNDFTLGDILLALLHGLQWTAILSLTAFVLGSLGGLIILALRLAHRPARCGWPKPLSRYSRARRC
jgi:ABC-type amino acid transport system permease subunit